MVSGTALADRLHRQITDRGPMAVSEWIEAALYDPSGGFYMTGGRAGRGGDFLTAPEVGPLFGAVIARALDSWWTEAGRPEHFPVYEIGAGPGTLARAVIRARPRVAETGALLWWAVEISPVQRACHPEHDLIRPVATAAEAFAEEAATVSPINNASGGGVVLANELLDNLPFDIVELADGGWSQLFVHNGDERGDFFAAVGEPDPVIDPIMRRLAPEASAGARLPWQRRAARWVAEMITAVPNGRVVAIDYGGHTAQLLGRGTGWLRTHVDHRGRSGTPSWISDPGHRDITSDIDFDQLQIDQPADLLTSQADFLDAHGIQELVAEGRRIWGERAHLGDLAAVAARSRIREAEALCGPNGMGSFHVAEWCS